MDVQFNFSCLHTTYESMVGIISGEYTGKLKMLL